MKKTLKFLLLLFVVPFYGQIQSYYNGLDLTKTGDELFLELSARLESTHSGIPYTGSPVDVWDACDEADQDPDISTNVLLIYGYDDTDGDDTTDRTRGKDRHQGSNGGGGLWNREHVFAKSLARPGFGTDEPGAGTDVHNLRPADSPRNSERSNRKFSDGSGTASFITSNGGWYPGDEWKGDVARIIMYMYTRYHGDGSQVSQTNCLPINVGFGNELAIDPNMRDLFLNWNVEDPVSDFESNRNEVLAGIQGNRNPFIDNPYLATLIWGELAAEDLWWNGSSGDTEMPTVPLNVIASNITDESFELNWDASTDNVEVYDYLIYIDGVYTLTSKTTSIVIPDLDAGTAFNVTIKARDISSNLSVESTVIQVKTLDGPRILFEEEFDDCTNIEFNSYSEASTKDWTCFTVYGENNSGSIGINGYQEAVASKDWLITNTPIDFDAETGEKLSFYTDAAYGSTSLFLVYSADYDGSGDPTNFTWINVPNVTIPIHSTGGSTEEVFTFSDIDISAINGTAVYVAFKYYSDGNPTRWTVDSFEIIADDLNPDTDGDGVLNEVDVCPNTPTGAIVNADGCSNGQLDDDSDGVQNSGDVCSDTPVGEDVNTDGCSASQLDDDNDGVMNTIDTCPNTPTGESVNATGCSDGQLDDDNDGVQNSDDVCADTPTGENVDTNGCSASQLDDDNDGVMNTIDTCPNTPMGESVNATGCSDSQLDDDNDGVMNNIDACPGTTSGSLVNAEGCFMLPLNNFSIETIGETCEGENNGQLIITAIENYNYSFSINSIDYSFTDLKTVEDLVPNTYELCIKVDNEDFEQCFNVVIEEAEEISGKATVTSNKVSIEIESGTAPFTVFKNGLIVAETSSDFVEVKNIKHGDLIEVKSKISCEGVISKKVELFTEFVAYPNPTKGNIQVTIPNTIEYIEVQIFNIQSLLISSKVYKVAYGKINLDIENQSSGVYYIKLGNSGSQVLRIVKE